MKQIDLKNTSIKLILSETPTSDVLTLVEEALKTYYSKRSPLALWNKIRTKIGSNPIKKLAAFATDLNEGITKGHIFKEKPLDSSNQARLLHILYGLAIPPEAHPILPIDYKGLGETLREKIEFEDSTTYNALLDIRVLILGHVFTECSEVKSLVKWNSRWNRDNDDALNQTVKLMVDRLYESKALLTEPQETIYYIYFSAKGILENSVHHITADKPREMIKQLQLEIGKCATDARKKSEIGTQHQAPTSSSY